MNKYLFLIILGTILINCTRVVYNDLTLNVYITTPDQVAIIDTIDFNIRIEGKNIDIDKHIYRVVPTGEASLVYTNDIPMNENQRLKVTLTNNRTDTRSDIQIKIADQSFNLDTQLKFIIRTTENGFLIFNI
jgi:hypothetical protein